MSLSDKLEIKYQRDSPSGPVTADGEESLFYVYSTDGYLRKNTPMEEMKRSPSELQAALLSTVPRKNKSKLPVLGTIPRLVAKSFSFEQPLLSKDRYLLRDTAHAKPQAKSVKPCSKALITADDAEERTEKLRNWIQQRRIRRERFEQRWRDMNTMRILRDAIEAQPPATLPRIPVENSNNNGAVKTPLLKSRAAAAGDVIVGRKSGLRFKRKKAKCHPSCLPKGAQTSSAKEDPVKLQTVVLDAKSLLPKNETMNNSRQPKEASATAVEGSGADGKELAQSVTGIDASNNRKDKQKQASIYIQSLLPFGGDGRPPSRELETEAAPGGSSSGGGGGGVGGSGGGGAERRDCWDSASQHLVHRFQSMREDFRSLWCNEWSTEPDHLLPTSYYATEHCDDADCHNQCSFPTAVKVSYEVLPYTQDLDDKP